MESKVLNFVSVLKLVTFIFGELGRIPFSSKDVVEHLDLGKLFLLGEILGTPPQFGEGRHYINRIISALEYHDIVKVCSLVSKEYLL